MFRSLVPDFLTTYASLITIGGWNEKVDDSEGARLGESLEGVGAERVESAAVLRREGDSVHYLL